MKVSAILNYLWRGWMLLITIPLTLILGIPVFLISKKLENYPKAYGLMRLWAYGIFYGIGFCYRFRNIFGKALDPNKSYVLIANHTSMIDIMLMLILHPKHPFFFVGKKELEKIPLFGILYRRICVTVDRNDPKSRASVYTRCAERMRLGHSIVIFPEGGVDDREEIILSDFKDGAFKLAEEHRFDIAVYSFKGLKKMFPFINSKGYPGKVEVELLDVIPSDTPFQISKERAYQKIYQSLT